MSKLCGCYGHVERDHSISVVFCPLHASAGDLFEALTALKKRANETCGASDLMEQVERALSRAEGRTEGKES